jgi:hypothetical protein
VKPLRNERSINRRATRPRVDDLRRVWPFVARMCLDVMLKGGNPDEVRSASLEPCEQRWALWTNLHNFTRVLSELARDRADLFEHEKLWKFAKCVHLWVCGYRTRAHYVEARSAFDVALIELRRLPTSNDNKGPYSANEERDRLIFEQYQMHVPLKKILQQVNSTTGWVRLGSETALRNAMIRHCKRNGIDIPKRKQPRNKRK